MRTAFIFAFILIGCASKDVPIQSYVTPNKDDETILRCHREGRYVDGVGGMSRDSGLEAYAHYRACMKDGGL